MRGGTTTELAEQQQQHEREERERGEDEKQTAATMKKEKIKQEKAKGKEPNEEEEVVAQPTYTRMSLQYLDLETLLYYGIAQERNTVSSPRRTHPHPSRFKDINTG